MTYACPVVSQEPVMTSTEEWSSGTRSRDFAYLASVSPESRTRLMLTPTSPAPGHATPPMSAATRSLRGSPGEWWTPSTGDRRSYLTAKYSGTGRLTTLPDLHEITGVTPNTTGEVTAECWPSVIIYNYIQYIYTRPFLLNLIQQV